MTPPTADRPPTPPLLVFVVVAYVLSVDLSLVIGLTGGHESRLIALSYLSMVIPAIAMLATMLVARESGPAVDWHRAPLRYLPVALLLMPIVMHAVMLPAEAVTGGLHWEPWLTPAPDGLYHTSAARGWGVLSGGALAGRMAVNAVVGLLVVSVLAFFEEIGWRAWLLPRLVHRLGPRRAVVASALIWAFWHTPFALSGIMHLDGIPPWLTAVVMPIGTTGSGLIIGWLWLRTESIWLVSLAHGSLNNWGQYAFKFTTGPNQLGDALVVGAGGLALIVAGGLLLIFARPADTIASGNRLPIRH